LLYRVTPAVQRDMGSRRPAVEHLQGHIATRTRTTSRQKTGSLKKFEDLLI
jgi:hypothetical protein